MMEHSGAGCDAPSSRALIQRGSPLWLAMMVSMMFAAGPMGCAEETQKTLPTLLIKGEVISVDSNDPTEALLRVRDRYGFETPLYVTPETEIAQGNQPLTPSELLPGAAIEVEYNFDINTAKRHAVRVTVAEPEEEAPAALEGTAPEATQPDIDRPTTTVGATDLVIQEPIASMAPEVGVDETVSEAQEAAGEPASE